MADASSSLNIGRNLGHKVLQAVSSTSQRREGFSRNIPGTLLLGVGTKRKIHSAYLDICCRQ